MTSVLFRFTCALTVALSGIDLPAHAALQATLQNQGAIQQSGGHESGTSNRFKTGSSQVSQVRGRFSAQAVIGRERLDDFH